MATYNGWEIIDIPLYPPAPASIDFNQVTFAAANVSPFTGQQQVQDWNATLMEVSVSMPPMTQANAVAWVAFLRALKGVVNVFQFTSAFMAAYPELGSRYWRLKSNTAGWTVANTRLYGVTFEIREAV